MSARYVNHIEALLRNYRRQIELPWEGNLAGAQKVWFAVYPPNNERRLRLRLPEFGNETTAAGHGWLLLDITNAFPQWLANKEYRDAYFEDPSNLTGPELDQFRDHLIATLVAKITAESVSNETVIALAGVGTLFGIVPMAEVIKGVAAHVRGRLVVFFPGVHERNTYRLLDAAVAWNYLALAISSDEGTAA
jgi:hypothetical protein